MIQVINRALDILEVLSEDLTKEYGLKEIADRMSLNHGTCANIIKTLLLRGYIEKGKGYTLGPNAYYLTNNFSNKDELLKACTEPMQQLREELKESCIIAILKNNMRITLHKETSLHELQANTRDEKNAYQTATGRILLAFLEQNEKASFLKNYGLPGQMWKEAKNEKELSKELTKIRKEGWAINKADSSIIGIAVPVEIKGKVFASLGIYLPEIRFNAQIRTKFILALKKTAELISKHYTK